MKRVFWEWEDKVKHEKVYLPDDEWYKRAITYLRGGADPGVFGLFIYDHVRRKSPSSLLNIGTGRGYSVACMAKGIEDNGSTGTIYTIDIIPPDEKRSWHVHKQSNEDPALKREFTMREFVDMFVSDAVDVIYLTGRSNEVLKSWKHSMIDLAFIDGDHSYEAVKSDIYRVKKILKQKGALILDDYQIETMFFKFSNILPHWFEKIPKFRTLRKILSKYTVNWSDTGVKRAVEEEIEQNNWEYFEAVRKQDGSSKNYAVLLRK